MRYGGGITSTLSIDFLRKAKKVMFDAIFQVSIYYFQFFFSISKNRKNATKLAVSDFYCKKGPNRVVQDRTR